MTGLPNSPGPGLPRGSSGSCGWEGLPGPRCILGNVVLTSLGLPPGRPWAATGEGSWRERWGGGPNPCPKERKRGLWAPKSPL